MGNQSVKAIVAVVVLICGIALITWQVKRMSNDPGKDTLMSETQQKGQAALETFFGQVNGKWNSDALWVDKATKTAGSSVAKEIFGDTPSISDIKIIDAAPDTEYPNQSIWCFKSEISISASFSTYVRGKTTNLW